jgi:hypothetical protein
VENVCIVDPVAGLISTKYAASTPNGSAAGITYPNSSNNGNNVCRGVAIWHLVTGALISSHVVLENYWVQNSGIGIYAPEGSYGSIVVKMQLQESDYCIRRAVLPALTNSLASGQYTPIGDLYGPANLSVPTHALGESHLYISLLNMESLHNALLADDPNYPLTVIANVNLAGNANKQLGSGANLVVNLIGNPAYAQTNVPGTSGGSAVYSQGGVTPWDKRFLIYFDGYENATGTAQTITFVNAFNRIPAVTANETALSTDQFVISAIALTLPVNMTDAITGYFILEGY